MGFYNNMEDIIEEQVQGESPQEVLELVLDQWKGRSVSNNEKKLIERFKNLDSLSLSGCGLESLEGFPNLPSLIKLDLSDNKIKAGLSDLKHLTEIMQVNFINNLIEDVNEFIHLKEFRSLVYLEVEGCPFALSEGFREKLFEIIPSLQIIDGINRQGEEIDLNDLDDEEFDEEDDDEEEEDDFEDDDEEESDQEKDKVHGRTKGSDNKNVKKR